MENLLLEGFGLLVRLLFVEIDPVNLLGDTVRSPEIGLGRRNGRLHSLSGQLSEFQEIRIQLHRNERPLYLELEQIVVQGVDDVVQGLQKTHDVSSKPHKT